MRNFVKPFLLAFALTSLPVVSANDALAIDQMRGTQAALAAQARTFERAKVPASYRITQDDTRELPAADASSRYFGGEIRTLIIDGRPVRLSEREIIDGIRAGRFVPVYTDTGARLSREDWEVSLPRWLAHATRDFAGQ